MSDYAGRGVRILRHYNCDCCTKYDWYFCQNLDPKVKLSYNLLQKLLKETCEFLWKVFYLCANVIITEKKTVLSFEE